jgi:hypothetical protein
MAKPYNGNRYAGKYDDYINQLRQQATQDNADYAQASAGQKNDDFWGNVAATAAPIAGATVGGLVGIPGGPAGIATGMKVGGGVGTAAGQSMGQGMYNAGSELMDPIRRREMQRQALLQAIMSAGR